MYANGPLEADTCRISDFYASTSIGESPQMLNSMIFNANKRLSIDIVKDSDTFAPADYNNRVRCP